MRKKAEVKYIGDFEDEDIHTNEYFKVVNRKAKDGSWDYTFTQKSDGNSRVCMILPHRFSSMKGKTEYLVRREVVPAWGLKDFVVGVGGGIDEGETAEQGAIRELLEETGYKVEQEQLQFLGQCYTHKGTDLIYYLYAVNLSGRSPEKAKGDGSEMEKRSESFWSDDISTMDPVLNTCFMRFRSKSVPR